MACVKGDWKYVQEDVLLIDSIEHVTAIERDIFNGKRKDVLYNSKSAYRVYKEFTELRLTPDEALAVSKSKSPRMALAGLSTLYPDKNGFVIHGLYFIRVDHTLWSVVSIKKPMPKGWDCEINGKPQKCGV